MSVSSDKSLSPMSTTSIPTLRMTMILRLIITPCKEQCPPGELSSRRHSSKRIRIEAI